MSKKKKDKDKHPLRALAWLDPHHRIELQALITALSVLLVIGAFAYANWQKGITLYKQSLAVSNFNQAAQFSKTTNTDVTLNTVQLSSDEKTALISFSFSSMQHIGFKADMYEFYLSDSQHKQMKYLVKGRFYLYPTSGSGKGILVLSSSHPIPSESLVLFMLNQKTYTTQDQVGTDNQIKQNNSLDSFGHLDIAQFAVNPGADNVVKNPRVNPNLDDLQSVYEAGFGSTLISQVMKQKAADEKRIAQYKQTTTNVEQRLASEGFNVPEPPAWVDDNWRPEQTVNVYTGKTAAGWKMGKAYAGNASLHLPKANLPNTLKSSKGVTMDSSTSANGDTPMGQWTNLQAAWQGIGQAKMNIYVNLYYKMYVFYNTAKTIPSQSTIGDSSRVKQIGATS